MALPLRHPDRSRHRREPSRVTGPEPGQRTGGAPTDPEQSTGAAEEPLTVELPDEPPPLSAPAARALLHILLRAHAQGGDAPL